MIHDAEADEFSSAEFAKDICRSMGLSKEFADASTDIIQSTDHISPPANNDSLIAIDIDLAIFAQSSEIFDEYEENIRKEYAHITDKNVRIEILRHFLERPSIFLTEYYKRKYELRARTNLERSILQLKK